MKIVICDYQNALEEDYSLTIGCIRKVYPQAQIVVCAYYNKEELYRVLEGADGLITAFLPLDKEFFAHVEGLKAVSLSAAGYGNVDLVAAKEAGVAVCHIAEYCTQEVAEHAFALMGALNRSLKYYDTQIAQKKEWRYSTISGGRTLSSQTLAIFGFGKIGRRVAKLARVYDMQILAVDPFLTGEAAKEAGAVPVSAEEAIREADIITNHMNLTEENYHFFDEEKFRKMERRPIFINVGRGACVDEAALVKALDEGLIRGAGLDVLEAEKPELNGNPLLGRPNVILTPHSAFYSEDSMNRLQSISADNLVYALKGDYEKVMKFVAQPGR